MTRKVLWVLALLVSWMALPPDGHADDEEDVPTPPTGVVHSDRAVEVLLDRLQSAESYKVRAQAAVLLGRLADVRAVPPLIRALQYDEHFVVRAAASTALGALADDRAAEPLLMVVGQDEEPIVRDAAARALTRLDARRNFEVLARFAREGLAEQRRSAVARLGDLARAGEQPSIDIVLAALGDELEVRNAAAAAIADLSTDRALPILVTALSHENVAVRAEAARLLGPRKDPRVVDPLMTAYLRPGEQERVRVEIRRSLEKLSILLEMNELIARARNGQDRETRVRALGLLGIVGDPRAASALEDMLDDPDPFIQGTAAGALADLGSVQSLVRLEEVLKTVKDTRAQAPLERAIKKLKRIKSQQR
jgi:HEAT repeat protein